MKFTIPRNDLLSLVSRAVGVTDSKSTMPILANVLIRAQGKSVSCEATDLYMSIRGTAEANVSEPGAICAPARDLAERIRNLPQGDVVVSADDKQNVTLKSSTTPRRYKLYGLPADSFPQLPDPQIDNRLTIAADKLLDIISRTHGFISTDETRPQLSSAQLVAQSGRLRVEATDGHRMSFAQAEFACKEVFKALVTLKSVTQLRKFLGEAEGEIALVLKDSNIFFGFAWGMFTAKLVDAQFPNVAAVIPQSYAHVARIPRMVAMEAIKAVSIASSDRTGGIKLRFTSGTLNLETQSPERGDGADEVPVDYDGPEFVIGFNAKYLLEGLAVLTGEDVEFAFNGDLDPAVLSEVGGRDDGLIVTMPMRL